ncbi:MAG: hypothetical protein AMXMBFR84_19640 [Candidatus Hydrogenedentota bacterium]
MADTVDRPVKARQLEDQNELHGRCPAAHIGNKIHVNFVEQIQVENHGVETFAAYGAEYPFGVSAAGHLETIDFEVSGQGAGVSRIIGCNQDGRL